MRDGPWKLVLPPVSRNIITKEPEKPYELYHLGNDAGETINLVPTESERAEVMYIRYLNWVRGSKPKDN